MYLVVCIFARITLHGGPEKWQKWERVYSVVPGDFLFNSTLFIHSPYQTSSQPMSGR